MSRRPTLDGDLSPQFGDEAVIDSDFSTTSGLLRGFAATYSVYSTLLVEVCRVSGTMWIAAVDDCESAVMICQCDLSRVSGDTFPAR